MTSRTSTEAPGASVTTPSNDVERVWGMLDLITPMAMRVAATLRLADHIEEESGELARIASRAGADPDALGRMLRYLVARGIFAEPTPDRFAVNDLALVLADSHPSATRAWIDLEGFGGAMDRAFFDLLATVRAGRPPAGGTIGEPTGSIRSSYDTAMEAQSRQQAPAIVAARDWSSVDHAVDVGGGTGTLLLELLLAYPKMSGTLVELPEAAASARRLLSGTEISGRFRIVAGDLFEIELPRGAQLYLLKFVLHGMSDEQAVRALQRCREAGGDTAVIVVIEGTVAPGDDRRSFTAMDLRMLVLTEGRERTVEEFATLAARAGLCLASTTPTAVGLHLLELRPAG